MVINWLAYHELTDHDIHVSMRIGVSDLAKAPTLSLS
jgi:hypothetical protein